jgi:hypothetical protein
MDTASRRNIDRRTLPLIFIIGGAIWALVWSWDTLSLRTWFPMSAEQALAQIEASEKQERALLPRRIDDSSALVGVSHDGLTVVSDVQVDTRNYDVNDPRTALKHARTSTLQKLCASRRSRDLLGAGARFGYVYRSTDNREIGRFEIDSTDCR